ncbi:MAG: hypothetical protein EZS28_042890, partial [Streblomastix strix]
MPLFWFQTLKQTHKLENEYVFVEGARRLIPPHMYVFLFVINVLNIQVESKTLQRKIRFRMNCDQKVLSVIVNNVRYDPLCILPSDLDEIVQWNLLFAYLLRIPGGILSEEVAREIIVISKQRKLMNKSEQQDVKVADNENAESKDNKQAKIDELAKAFLLLPRENRVTFQILLELMHDIAVTPRFDQQQQQQQQLQQQFQSSEKKEHDHTAHITTPLAVASFFIPHITHTHPIITTNKLPQSPPQLVDALAFSIENYEEIWESIIMQSSGNKSASGFFPNRIELKQIPVLHQMLNKLIRHLQSPPNMNPYFASKAQPPIPPDSLIDEKEKHTDPSAFDCATTDAEFPS